MEFKVVNRHRHSANPLTDEVGSPEPLPTAAAVGRALAKCFLFSAIVAGLLLGAAGGALGVPIPGLINTGTVAMLPRRPRGARKAQSGIARNSRMCAAITGQAGSCSSMK